MAKIKIRLATLSALIFLLPASIYSQWDSRGYPAGEFDTALYLPHYYNDRLLMAAFLGRVPEIERVLKKGANINVETMDGATPLIYAVQNKHTKAVETILKYKPVVDKVYTGWNTPLMIAAKNQSFDIAEMLIRAGADVDHADRYGATSLHYAATYGYPDITDLLLYYEADRDKKTDDGSTPLHAAIWAGQITVADILLQSGAVVDERDYKGMTPFLLSAYFGDTVSMELLLDQGANLAEKNNKGYNALTLAIMSKHNPAVEYLLTKKTGWKDVEPASDPYLVASKYSRKDVLDILGDKKVPGKINYHIDQLSYTLSSRFTLHDMYTGISLNFREPLIKGGFSAGFDTKLWPTRVLIKSSEDLTYQFWDKSSLAWAGLFKDFTIAENASGTSLMFNTSLSIGYSFGNRFKGSYMAPESKVRILPAASVRLDASQLSFSAGIEYVNTGYYKPRPLWLRLGISWTSFFDDVRMKIKPPRWY